MLHTGSTTFVFGGVSSGVAVDRVSRLGAGDSVWTLSSERMLEARQSHSAAVFDGSLFAIGGYGNNGSLLSSVESMEPSTGIWSRRSSLPVVVGEGQAAVYNGSLYSCGGVTTLSGLVCGILVGLVLGPPPFDKVASSSILNACYVLSSKRGVWVRGPRMVRQRCRFSLAVVQGELYALGGGGYGSYSVERLNPSTGNWELLLGKMLFRLSLSSTLVLPIPLSV